MIIYLRLLLPLGSSDLPESKRAILRFLFGLASDGVYICPSCHQLGGSLLSYPSTLTTNVAVYFCCTSLGVTSTGRYPASCPMKPGLSSPVTFRTYSRDHPSYSPYVYTTFSLICKVFLYVKTATINKFP